MIKKLILAAATLLLSTALYAQTVTISVDGVFQFDEEFLTNIGIINSLKPTDTLIIDINSPGGSVAILAAYLEAIQDSGVYYIARVGEHGLAASAGAVLMCAADKAELADNSVYLIHNAKTGDPTAPISYADRIAIYNLIITKCGKYLTENEKWMLNTQDTQVWLTGYALNHRYVQPEQPPIGPLTKAISQ